MKQNEFSRKAWLNYFNRAMKDAGMITEDQYRKLKFNIAQKYKGRSGTKSHNRGAQ